MKENKDNKKNIKVVNQKNNSFKDAEIYKANLNFDGKYVTVKLPKTQLFKYLGLDKNDKTINIIPMNGSVQMVKNLSLTCIPAIDLSRVEEFFKPNV